MDSLAHSGDGLATRLILVDNASIDGAEQWRPYFPEIEIVRNPQRLHYAANLNRILAASTSRYTLLLNTDMYFDPAAQCLAKMVAFMERQPALRAVGLPAAARRRLARPVGPAIPDRADHPRPAAGPWRADARHGARLSLCGSRRRRVV